MAALEIGEAYVRRVGGRSRCCSNISWGDRGRTLWFEVDRQYEECLCTERVDGFLVALLPFAMTGGLNIHSEGRVSERLLYQLKTMLLPSLSDNISALHPINIDAEADGRELESKNGVGTALSCGVDSFYLGFPISTRDFPYQLAMRHPAPHCLVANDMSMAPGCQSPLRSPAIVSLDVRIVHHCPWHPRPSALAKLSTRKKAILSLSSSSDCLYLFGWHLAG